MPDTTHDDCALCAAGVSEEHEQESERVAITSVWSAFGHRFMSTDCAEHEACLRCGAMFVLTPRPGDPTSGEYHAANGDDPVDCPGADAGWRHGYPGERFCDEGDRGRPCAANEETGTCEHVSHACNCLCCDS